MELSDMDKQRLKLCLRMITIDEWEYDLSDKTFTILGWDVSKINKNGEPTLSELRDKCSDFIYECIIKASQKE